MVNSHKIVDAPQPRTRLVHQLKFARMLLPVIHFMAAYGLRIGAIPTIKLSVDYFTVTEKENISRRIKLKQETWEIIKKYRLNRNILAHVKRNTVQVVVKRITRYLYSTD